MELQETTPRHQWQQNRSSTNNQNNLNYKNDREVETGEKRKKLD